MRKMILRLKDRQERSPVSYRFDPEVNEMGGAEQFQNCQQGNGSPTPDATAINPRGKPKRRRRPHGAVHDGGRGAVERNGGLLRLDANARPTMNITLGQGTTTMITAVSAKAARWPSGIKRNPPLSLRPFEHSLAEVRHFIMGPT
jgi:hypothetical protein